MLLLMENIVRNLAIDNEGIVTKQIYSKYFSYIDYQTNLYNFV